ncbi:NAD+ kinase [Parelusimicrobium proximum]|uniref:NAD(+)/NADH kinase n=1 Tax=Parelusimicrobium proximum TaxID=3228953 RepID=UPI003D180566
MEFKNIAVYASKDKPKCAASAVPVKDALEAFKFSVRVYGSLDDESLAQNTDLLISVGGDGSMLRAVRAAAELGVPVLGLNAGNLGFLTGADIKDFESAVYETLVLGKYKTERRSLLSVSVKESGKYIFKSKLCLNDCIVKALGVRATQLQVFFNGENLETFFGDGLIVATPTGSTAYSLAAGGSIAHPATDTMMLTPICPHTLSYRPLLLPEGNIVITPKLKTEFDRATVSLDGQLGVNISNEGRVEIRISKRHAKIMFTEGYDFFQSLRHKFRWGGR